jgi:hypothetical protein
VILNAHGTRHGTGGRVARYYEMTRQARSLLDDDSPLEERIFISVGVGYSAWVCGRVGEAQESFEHVERLAKGDPNAGFSLVGFSAWTWSLHQQSMALNV